MFTAGAPLSNTSRDSFTFFNLHVSYLRIVLSLLGQKIRPRPITLYLPRVPNSNDYHCDTKETEQRPCYARIAFWRIGPNVNLSETTKAPQQKTPLLHRELSSI